MFSDPNKYPSEEKVQCPSVTCGKVVVTLFLGQRSVLFITGRTTAQRKVVSVKW